MADHPIIFSAPMIRALLDGRKSMTRRLAFRDAKPAAKWSFKQGDRWVARTPWQRVKPGDRLWCRETWTPHASGIDYAADIHEAQLAQAGPWRSPIHMPRTASRLTLVVTATKIERVQEISNDDCEAEGIESELWDQAVAYRNYAEPEGWFCMWGGDDCYTKPGVYVASDRIQRRSFQTLWESINGPGSWDANPECVCISFTVHKTNIDAMAKAA